MKKYLPTDPHIVNIFRNHCLEGYSPRYFISKLEGGEKSYCLLRKINPKFEAVIQEFQRKNFSETMMAKASRENHGNTETTT